ncbi:MAG: hypothetical protein A2X28_07905 [Elusimicrobia bacterium GWA2_56_46]|nr:MAG: hypothetical protein A2X28_07905 [Elusimicrobia bacterium GWA2_56_46]OGR54320.1 MAG: hypothetical protein A2X39_03805 [Elusimicrobia bacterium GWC2_56_31]HBB66558.1 DNA-binding response regulator [Elusimicrobiota bacterium]HBW22392.1 DNA-binding response regulator [Elusimicrobiota bacterium]
MKKNSQARIKIFIVDDHPAVREGVRSCLNGNGAFLVVGEAGDDKEALRKLRNVGADIILLDINLPSLDGGELARRVRQTIPAAKIIAFSIYASQEHVVRMARCGVHGYVTKDAPIARLMEAIHHVHRGGLHFPPDMTDAILSPGTKPAGEGGDKALLTAREKEVLVLLSEGLANKEVARKLGISVRTAETHREHVLRKLNITNIAGLTKYAIQHGLTPLGPAKPNKASP